MSRALCDASVRVCVDAYVYTCVHPAMHYIDRFKFACTSRCQGVLLCFPVVPEMAPSLMITCLHSLTHPVCVCVCVCVCVPARAHNIIAHARVCASIRLHLVCACWCVRSPTLTHPPMCSRFSSPTACSPPSLCRPSTAPSPPSLAPSLPPSLTLPSTPIFTPTSYPLSYLSCDSRGAGIMEKRPTLKL